MAAVWDAHGQLGSNPQHAHIHNQLTPPPYLCPNNDSGQKKVAGNNASRWLDKGGYL
jgi:hypothetical protein